MFVSVCGRRIVCAKQWKITVYGVTASVSDRVMVDCRIGP